MSSSESFENLGLISEILAALVELGYESPSPIQEASIPVLLGGSDLLAQAQTGTGKTAAFALPILSELDLANNYPQALILTPTRELAIQVAAALKGYAKHLDGFHVLPIYGGQNYRTQLRALKRGVHVVVGTPGRIMDHLRRETLNISDLKTVVLDEADEMLKMGFIDDVKWILEQVESDHQTALFSATIPGPIKKVANTYLNNPERIHIKSKTTTVEAIEQFYTIVTKKHKMEALTRFLEVEDIDAMIIFSRTKVGTEEVANHIEAMGYAAAAMNGDMNQKQRENVISRLKRGGLDIVVATEVAARGLDVTRVSHVINFDAPYNAESYTHRIGRTGRAGKTGKALLFVSPKELGVLKEIERTTRQTLKKIDPPSSSQVAQKRTTVFTNKILQSLAKDDLDFYREYIEDLVHSTEHSELDIAAALASLIKGIKPESTDDIEIRSFETPRDKSDDNKRRRRRKRFGDDDRNQRRERHGRGSDTKRSRDSDTKRKRKTKIHDEDSQQRKRKSSPKKKNGKKTRHAGIGDDYADKYYPKKKKKDKKASSKTKAKKKSKRRPVGAL